MKAAVLCWPAFVVLVTLAVPAPPTSAQDYGVDSMPYPASSTSEPIVQGWINRYLPTKGYVVGAWSPNVVMLVSVQGLQTDAFPQVTTEVLSEVLKPEAADAAGWRAALQTIIFDCAQNQYRSISNLYFARGDRRGGFDQDSGDGVWHRPDPGATMDTVERAACFYGLRNRKAQLAGRPPALAARPASVHGPASRAAGRKAKTARIVKRQTLVAKTGGAKTVGAKTGANKAGASKTGATKTPRAKAAPRLHPAAEPPSLPDVAPHLSGLMLH